jgi:hypothetical protein
MDIYNFKTIQKATLSSRDINLGFDIAGSTIKMQFNYRDRFNLLLAWSTLDNTFTVNNPLTGAITMNKRIFRFKTSYLCL